MSGLDNLRNSGNPDAIKLADNITFAVSALSYLAVIPLVFFRHTFGARALKKRHLIFGFLLLSFGAGLAQSTLLSVLAFAYLGMGIFHHKEIIERRKAGNPHKIPHTQLGIDWGVWYLLPGVAKHHWLLGMFYQPALLVGSGYLLTFYDPAFGLLLMVQGFTFIAIYFADMKAAKERQMDNEDAIIEAGYAAEEMVAQHEVDIERDSFVSGSSSAAVSGIEVDSVKQSTSSAIKRDSVKKADTVVTETA